MVQFNKWFSNLDAAGIFVKLSRFLLVEFLSGRRQHHIMKILYYPPSQDEVSHRENSPQIFLLEFGMQLNSQNKTKTTKINKVNFIIIRRKKNV